MATRYPLVPSVFFKNIVAMPRRLLYPPPSVDLCAPYGPIMCFREWGKTGRHDPSGMSGGALARRARSVDESCASSQCKLQRRRYRQPHPDFTSLKEPVRPQPIHRSSTDLPHIRYPKHHDHMVAILQYTVNQYRPERERGNWVRETSLLEMREVATLF